MDIYERLREVLDAHPSTAPKAKAIEIINPISTLTNTIRRRRQQIGSNITA